MDELPGVLLEADLTISEFINLANIMRKNHPNNHYQIWCTVNNCDVYLEGNETKNDVLRISGVRFSNDHGSTVKEWKNDMRILLKEYTRK